LKTGEGESNYSSRASEKLQDRIEDEEQKDTEGFR